MSYSSGIVFFVTLKFTNDFFFNYDISNAWYFNRRYILILLQSFEKDPKLDYMIDRNRNIFLNVYKRQNLRFVMQRSKKNSTNYNKN